MNKTHSHIKPNSGNYEILKTLSIAVLIVLIIMLPRILFRVRKEDLEKLKKYKAEQARAQLLKTD